jgi:hypothetical protein
MKTKSRQTKRLFKNVSNAKPAFLKNVSNAKPAFLKNANPVFFHGNPVNKKNKTKKSKPSCDDFCKSYIDEIDKQNKELAKGTNIPYDPKIGRAFRMATCQKNFCNKNCKTYKYYDQESKELFQKNMKNNFITNMKPTLINAMKEKGAISYCDGSVYNPFNKK